MADGNSIGPGITPPVSPAESVIQAGDFASELDDVQINLHMMNNHAIKNLVLAFAEAAARPVGVGSGDRAMRKRGMSSAEIAAHRDGQRQERLSRLEAALADNIEIELQRVSDVFSQTADVLNATNANGAEIRAEISRIDAQIAPIASQLDTLAQQMEVWHADMIPSEAGREGLARTMDASGIPPPSRSAVGYDTLHDSWASALLNQSYHRPYLALMNASGNLRQQYRSLSASYPAEYKRYQRLLGGYSDLDEPIDWGNIVSTAVWIIATEVAFHAAAIALAPVTGGVGTAILYAGRMAQRAGQLGRLAASGIRSGAAVARWLMRIEQRLWEPFENAFATAVTRLRDRGVIRRGQPGGQVQGRGQAPTTARCAGVVCTL